MQEQLARLRARFRGFGARPPAEPPGLVALDVGTEFAKALVLEITQDEEGRQVGSVRGSGRQRQGLTYRLEMHHMLATRDLIGFGGNSHDGDAVMQEPGTQLLVVWRRGMTEVHNMHHGS